MSWGGMNVGATLVSSTRLQRVFLRPRRIFRVLLNNQFSRTWTREAELREQRDGQLDTLLGSMDAETAS